MAASPTTSSPDPQTAGIGLSPEQVEVFADGLYYLAVADGVHDNELALIREFLLEAGREDYADQLGARPFELERATALLDTSFVRRLFIKAAILLVRADHVVSDDERALLEFLAEAMGLSGELSALEAEVDGESLE